MATFPWVRFEQLPLSASDGSNASLVAVLNNTSTVRIRWVDLTAKFAVLTTGDIGGDTDSDFSIREDGVFSRHNTGWGKSPRYKQSNWGDLTKDTRFLKVDSTMSLSKAEVHNVWTSIGIRIADQNAIGLVRGSKSEIESYATSAVGGRIRHSVYIDSTGEISLPVAGHSRYGMVKIDNEFIAVDPFPDKDTAVTGEYVHYAVKHAISKLWRTPATNSSMGMVMGGTEANSVNVDPDTGAMTVPLAITPGVNYPGLTYLAHGTYQSWYANRDLESSWAAPASLVSEMVEHKMLFHQIPAKYNERMGAVTPTKNIVCTEDGDIYVRKATQSQDGAVILAPELFAAHSRDYIVHYYGDYVPTLKSVSNFLTSCSVVIGSKVYDNMPSATDSAIGGIKTSNTVMVNSSGMAFVPNASHTSAGVCKVFGASGDSLPVAANYHHVSKLLGPATNDNPGTVLVRGVSSDNVSYTSVVSAEEFDLSVNSAASASSAGIVKVKNAVSLDKKDYKEVPLYSEYHNSIQPATSTTPGRVRVNGIIDAFDYPLVPSMRDIDSLSISRSVFGECEMFDVSDPGSSVHFDSGTLNVKYNTLYYRLRDGSDILFRAGTTGDGTLPYTVTSYDSDTGYYSLEFDICVETGSETGIRFIGWTLSGVVLSSSGAFDCEDRFVYRFRVNYNSISGRWVLRLIDSYDVA